MALAAYRHVLQSFRIAFRDDARMLSAARVEARFKFESSRSLDSDSLEVKNKVAEAEEVARILRQNLVQGQQLKGAEEGEQTFRLRIHEETERGDNETAKLGTNPRSVGESCRGGAT